MGKTLEEVTVNKNGSDVLLSIDGREYNYTLRELVEGQLQGSLGYVIVSKFRGVDQSLDVDKLTIVKQAIRDALR